MKDKAKDSHGEEDKQLDQRDFWTNRKPKEDGWYFWRSSELDHKAQVREIKDGMIHEKIKVQEDLYMIEVHNRGYGLWSNKIKVPFIDPSVTEVSRNTIPPDVVL